MTSQMATQQRDAELTRFLLTRLDDEAERATTAFQRADIRARRAIVAGCAPLDDTLEIYGVAAPLDGADILCWLALPYAGHPDHRPEWNPEN